MSTIKFYQGTKLLDTRSSATDGKEEEKKPDPYIPDPGLVKAVQFAQVLGRPLLLKGEPGCGKTKLAEAVAYELFGPNYEQYFFKWYVKSSSKAKDGLYTINYLQRLQDAGIKDKPVAENGDNKGVDIILPTGQTQGNYIELGELGKAFQLTNTMKKNLPPPVVLIDEIDKADIDFPNDLLLELDEMKFSIPEAKNEHGEMAEINADRQRRPLVIITSNNEKPLPPAFLRRCIFHYIEFPGPDDLCKIVTSRNFKGMEANAIEAASRLFSALRYAIDKEGTASKNITTSELLDWIMIIDYYYQENKGLFDPINPETVAFILKKYATVLAKDEATKNMIEDAQRSIVVIGNTLTRYKEYEAAGANPVNVPV